MLLPCYSSGLFFNFDFFRNFADMIRIFISLILVMSYAMVSQAFPARNLSSLSSDSLIALGKYYGDERHMNDSAYYCFAIAADRYRPDMTRDEKLECIEALNLEFHKLTFSLLDYSKSYSCLLKAKEIASEIGEIDPRIIFNFGSYFFTAGEQTGNHEWKSKALEYFEKAFDVSMQKHDYEMADNVFPNLISTAYSGGQFENQTSRRAKYAAIKSDDPLFHSYNMMFDSIFICYSKGKPQEAIPLLHRQLAIVPDVVKRCRLRSMCYAQLSNLAIMRRDFRESEIWVDSLRDVAMRHGLTEVAIDTYRQLARIRMKQGDIASETAARLRYFEGRDSLLNERITNNVNSILFYDRLQDVSRELETSLYHQRLQLIALGAIGIMLICVTVFILILRSKNRKLQKAHAALYCINRQMFADFGKKRTNESSEPEKATTPSVDREKPRATSDPLLIKDVTEVMQSKEVFNPDFSLSRLTEIVSSNPKYVSNAVHDIYGTSFTQAVANLRVAEACRRISDSYSYSNLTLEAIANGVGFKSRTSFITAFRRVTGMTPGEYQRQARLSNEASDDITV